MVVTPRNESLRLTSVRAFLRVAGVVLTISSISVRAQDVLGLRKDVTVFATKDRPIGELQRGAIVSLVELRGDWAKVRYHFLEGYFEGFIRADALPTSQTSETADSVLAHSGRPVQQADSQPKAQPPLERGVSAISQRSPPAYRESRREPRESQSQTNSLQLSPFWNSPLRSGKKAALDTKAIIASNVSAHSSLESGAPLWGNTTYLMSYAEARKALGLGVASKTGVICPGFPVNSFFYYKHDQRNEGCNKLLLIVDAADQLVGVQIVDETPEAPRLSMHTSEYRLFNFIQSRTKANPDGRIAHTSGSSGHLVIVQSEYIDRKGKCREYSKLWLAMPVVQKIAERLQDY